MRNTYMVKDIDTNPLLEPPIGSRAQLDKLGAHLYNELLKMIQGDISVCYLDLPEYGFG